MMIRGILTFAFIFLCLVAPFAQVLNQDSEGESSIVYPGALVYFNVTETQVGFSYNNLPRTIVKKSGLLLGATLKGESKTGTLDFLNKGEFVPSSKISGVIGYYSNFHQSSEEKMLRISVRNNARRIRLYTLKTLTELKKKFKEIVDGSVLQSADRTRLIDEFDKLTKNLDFPKTASEMKENVENDFAVVFEKEKDNVKTILKQFSPGENDKESEADKIIKQYYLNVEKAKSTLEGNRQKIKKEREKTILGFSVYFAGGLEATGYDFIDTTKFEASPFASISDENFAQGEYLFGTNLNIGGSWILGLGLGMRQISNFQSLTKSEFTLQETVEFSAGMNPDTTNTITKKKAQTVYDTKPKIANHFSLKADIVYYYPTENGNIALNAYLRHQSPNELADTFTQVTNLGFGAYFNNSKGKFQGGLYVQFNDINDNRSELKMNNTSLDFGERISFGVISKFAIGSVFQRLDTAK